MHVLKIERHHRLQSASLRFRDRSEQWLWATHGQDPDLYPDSSSGKSPQLMDSGFTIDRIRSHDQGEAVSSCGGV